jgi:hypothetical protein
MEINMKIKVDYVTNSSSEVFGVVAGNSVILAILTAFLSGLVNGGQVQRDITDITAPQLEEINTDASSMAQEIAKAVAEDAKKQEQIIKDAYVEAKNTIDSVQSALEKELEEVNSNWDICEKTGDKTDPGYEALKKQYDDYREYLKYQIEQTKYRKQLVEYEEAVKQAEMDSKSEWVRQRQQDLIAAKEEKAMLEAVAKGYNKPGYDIEAVNVRLKQLSEREAELNKVLADNNASIDYTAADRGVIGPSKEAEDLTEKIRKEKEAYKKAAKKASEVKKAQLKAEMDKNIAEYEDQIARANKYDIAVKAAEGVQYGADVAIDGLSYVTGPAGQKIKMVYTAGKSVATGVGEGMADPKNAVKHIAKGIIEGGTEVLKDKFGDDKPWQSAAADILKEGLTSGIDASIKGENVADAVGKGLTKGVFDVGVDKALDKIKDKAYDKIKTKYELPDSPEIDAGDKSLSSIFNNNPLTRNMLKTSAKGMTESTIKDAIKEKIVDKAGKEGGFIDEE